MRVDFADDFEANVAERLDKHVSPRWCTSVTIRQSPANNNVLLLTDGQRDCLRLVYNHMKSKDIARALGVSPHTVDMRLRTAMRTLGVASRIEAARLLVQEESGGETTPDMYQPLIYQAPDVADADDPGTMQSPALDSGFASEVPIFSDLGFESAPSSPVVDPLVNGPPRLASASMDYGPERAGTARVGAGSFDPGSGIHPTDTGFQSTLPWGRRNDLSVGTRLGWIFLIAVGSALSFGAILAALAALKTLV